MTALTFERPAGPRRVARAVVRRPRPALVPVPVVDDQERALHLVREALDQTQLKTALSHAAPARYGELRALTAGSRYYSPERRALAEHLAVEGLLDLGLVQLYDRARQTSIAIENARNEVPRRNEHTMRDWQASTLWGGVRRSGELDSLLGLILDGRNTRAEQASPAGGTPSMPVRADAARYPVAPGATATADEIVSVVFGYWPHIEHDHLILAPVITGPITTWFRTLVHTLWTGMLTDYAVVEFGDMATVDAARARAIELERAALADLLEQGQDYSWSGGWSDTHHVPMLMTKRTLLRFIEIHLADAFGFTGHDARTRHAQMDITDTRLWTRP